MTLHHHRHALDLAEQLDRAWAAVRDRLPVIGTAVAALLGFHVLAWILRRSVAAVLRRAGLDRNREPGRLTRLLAAMRPGLEPSTAVAQVVFVFVVLVGWLVALDVLGVPAVRDTLQALLGFAPKLASAIAILAFGAFIASGAGRVVAAFLQELGSPLARLLGAMVEIGLLVVVAAIALGPLADTTVITANLTVIIGLLGALITFLLAWAMRRPAEQIIANYYLRRLVTVGDSIELAGVRGTVVAFAPLGVVVRVDDMDQLVPARHVLDGLRYKRA